MDRIARLPEEYAGSSDRSDLESFVTEVELYVKAWSRYHRTTPAQAAEWDDDCITAAASRLSGKARKWWLKAQRKDSPASWPAFQAMLTSYFTMRHNPVLPREKLMRLRQTGSAAEYVDAYQELMPTLPAMEDADLLAYFKFNAKPGVQVRLTQARPTTMEEAFELALECDVCQDYYRRAKRGRDRSESPPGKPPGPGKRSREAASASQSNRKKKETSPAGAQKRTQADKPKGDKTTKTTSRDEVQCYACKGFGHYASECANRRNQRSK